MGKAFATVIRRNAIGRVRGPRNSSNVIHLTSIGVISTTEDGATFELGAGLHLPRNHMRFSFWRFPRSRPSLSSFALGDASRLHPLHYAPTRGSGQREMALPVSDPFRVPEKPIKITRARQTGSRTTLREVEVRQIHPICPQWVAIVPRKIQ